MRAALFAILAMGTFSALDTTPAAAANWGAPYCMRTMYDTDDCSYFTYKQCMDTSSGLGTWCHVNPALAFNRAPQMDEPAPRKRVKRRHAN